MYHYDYDEESWTFFQCFLNVLSTFIQHGRNIRIMMAFSITGIVKTFKRSPNVSWTFSQCYLKDLKIKKKIFLSSPFSTNQLLLYALKMLINPSIVFCKGSTCALKYKTSYQCAIGIYKVFDSRSFQGCPICPIFGLLTLSMSTYTMRQLVRSFRHPKSLPHVFILVCLHLCVVSPPPLWWRT